MAVSPSTDRYAPTTGTRFWHRHAWLGVLVVGGVLFYAVERTLVATRNPNFVPTAILIGAAVVPAAFVAFIVGRRLPYSVGGALIGVAALIGGVIGVIVAGTLEFDTARDLGGLPMVGVGLIEEASKLIVPAAILVFLPRYRSPANGLLLGVASGAGFAALETMGYGFTALLGSKGSITAAIDTLLLRGFLSPAGHMTWTGITATALFTAAVGHGQRHRWSRFVGAFVLAVALHAMWDSQSTLIGLAVVAVVSLAVLAWTVHRVHQDADRRTGFLAPVR